VTIQSPVAEDYPCDPAEKREKQSLLFGAEIFMFPGSDWECLAWRLCLHYRDYIQPVSGQGPEDKGSQAEPGNQRAYAFRATFLARSTV